MREVLNPVLKAVAIAIASLIIVLSPVRGDERQNGIRTTITRQLEAFRQNNADAAWAIASPSIQKLFGTRDRFMAMVDTHYPQIMNSKSAIFKGIRTINGIIVQRVFIEGLSGVFVDAYYSMKLIDGMWRITGVHITRPGAEMT